LKEGYVIESKRIDKIDAIKDGWRIFKDNFELMFALFILMIVVSAALQIIAARPFESYSLSEVDPPASVMLFTFIVLLSEGALRIIFQMGFSKILLKFVDSREAIFNDVLSCYHLFFKYFFGSVLYGLIIALGSLLVVIGAVAAAVILNLPSFQNSMVLLEQVSADPQRALIFIILIMTFGMALATPAIIWSIKYGFFALVIVDKELGPIDALKESAFITDGAKWELAIFSGVLLGFNLLGLIAFGIGILITIPVSIISHVVVYRRLSEQSENFRLKDVAIEDEISDNTAPDTII